MLNAVKTGAAAVSRTAQKNPLETLISIIEGDPTADVERLFLKWMDVVREDDDLLVPALRHTFTNLLSCVDRDRRQSKIRVVHSRAETQRRVDAIKDKVVSVLLMNLTLPNGKRLREATFRDCTKAGGFFALVAKKGKPGQIVGRVLSEEDLRTLNKQF